MPHKKRNNHKINIYQLNGIKDTNKAKLKLLGYIKNESFEDEEIIIDKKNDKSKSNIKKIMDNVYVKMYKCRMTDEYVSQHKKLPVMYASIFYEKKFITGYLFSIYIYFEIITETNKLKSLESLLKTQLDGKYSIEIIMDEKNETINLNKFLGYDEMIDQLFTIIETEEMKEIISFELKKKDEERIKRLGKIFDDKPKEPKYNFNELLGKYEKGEDILKIINENK